MTELADTETKRRARRRPHVTYANVMPTLAFLFALTGGAVCTRRTS